MIHIRAALLTDAEAIRRIYNWAVENTTATMDTEPRPAAVQQLWMTVHDAESGYPALVAETDAGVVIGYAALSPYNPKPGYRFTAENSLYVHPDWQGRGIGKRLLQATITAARAQGLRTVVALITADNAASLHLHRQFGFTDKGTLRQVGTKFDRWVDVTFLQKMLDED